MTRNEFALSKFYLCVCNQSFNNKSLVRKHVNVCNFAQNQSGQCAVKRNILEMAISKSEMQSVKNDLSTCNDQLLNRFKCGCEKHFKSKGGYYRHIKKCKLRPKKQIVAGRTKCNEPGCLFTFKYIRDLRQHLNEIHKIKFDVDHTIFNTYSDFLCWKENYEMETRSYFYNRKTEIRNERKVEYWYCNRSGIYQSVLQDRRRKLKSQGILKINNNCTSSITLTINEKEGSVRAVIYHTHYGHEAELVHLRIPKSDKQEITSKLLQGVKIDDILHSFEEDGSSNNLIKRKHLIKRRDILNISKKCNVNIILPKIQEPLIQNKKRELVQQITKSLNKNLSINMIETKKRHIVASQLDLSYVHPISDNVWKVSIRNNLVPTTSSNNHCNDVYQVSKNEFTCGIDDCLAYCYYCNVCYHSYSCTCADYTSKTIICEHIHIVLLFLVTPKTFESRENTEKPIFSNQDHTTYTRSFLEPSISNKPNESVNLHENLSENNYDMLNTQNIKLEKIKSLKLKLEKIMLETLQKINKCNNCDLLENIDSQMSGISNSLSIDLLQKKSS